MSFEENENSYNVILMNYIDNIYLYIIIAFIHNNYHKHNHFNHKYSKFLKKVV